MGGRGGSSGLGGGGEQLQVAGRRYSLKKWLDENDIRHANDASLFDAGDATKREFVKNVREIDGMYFEDKEKMDSVNRLAELTTAQLKAESKSINPYVSGPARFNRTQVSRNADSAANARQKVNSYMQELRDRSRKNQKAHEERQLVNAMKTAEAKGLKEFTFNGVTYKKRRKYWTN